MKAHQQSSSAISAYDKLKEESGIVLIAVLVLLVTLTLIGVTAFFASSTNVKVGGNYRTGETALQVAMAGAEQPEKRYGRPMLSALIRQTSARSFWLALVRTEFLTDIPLPPMTHR